MMNKRKMVSLFVSTLILCRSESTEMKVWKNIDDFYETNRELQSISSSSFDSQSSSSESSISQEIEKISSIIKNTAKIDLPTSEKVAILWKAKGTMGYAFEGEIWQAIGQVIPRYPIDILRCNYEVKIAKMLIMSQFEDPRKEPDALGKWEFKRPFDTNVLEEAKSLLEIADANENKLANELLKKLLQESKLW